MTDYKPALAEWLDKTDWVKKEVSKGANFSKYLGMHRADVIKDLVEALRAENSKLKDSVSMYQALEAGDDIALNFWKSKADYFENSITNLADKLFKDSVGSRFGLHGHSCVDDSYFEALEYVVKELNKVLDDSPDKE